MSYEQFWDMDCTLVQDYRKAEELQNEKRNQEMWLQGLYVYEALCDVAPILRAFSKKGAKPHKYSSEPYALSARQRTEAVDRQNKKVFDKGLAMMEALIKSTNKKFANDEKEVTASDGND